MIEAATDINEHAIKDGAHPCVHADDYNAIDAVRHSVLKWHHKAPKHVHHAMYHPKPPTPQMTLGSFTHGAVLEPDTFEDSYYYGLDIDRRSNANKEKHKAWDEENHGKTLITHEDHHLAKGMIAAVWDHPEASTLLSGDRRQNEVTIVWTDEETGLRCKCRPDRLTRMLTDMGEFETLIDLKTTGRDASPYGRMWYCRDQFVDTQMAFYLMGMRAVQPNLGHIEHRVILVEKDAPHGVAVFPMDEETMDRAAEDVRRWLNRHATCVESGEWPDYATIGHYAVNVPRRREEG